MHQNLKNYNIIFDLDGTLIDSSESIALSIRTAFEIIVPELNYIGISKSMIGPPIELIVDNLLPANKKEKKSSVIEAFKVHYDATGCLNAKLFSEINAVLGLLAQNSKLFIATNKRITPTRKIIDFQGWSKLFKEVYTIDKFDTNFENKSLMLASLLSNENIVGGNTILVGDSYEDYLGAKDNSINFIRAEWGYGGKKFENLQHNSISKPSDIVNFL